MPAMDQTSRALLAVWLEEHPGRRPQTWWRVDAPRQPAGRWPDCFWDGVLEEPRLRLGGAGTPAHEVLNYVPAYYSGIPYPWVTAWDVAWCTGTARDIYGELINPQAAEDPEPFPGVAIDPTDPPRYEAQAAYLKRHKLLLRGEEKRLRPADFEPEGSASLHQCTAKVGTCRTTRYRDT